MTIDENVHVQCFFSENQMSLVARKINFGAALEIQKYGILVSKRNIFFHKVH